MVGHAPRAREEPAADRRPGDFGAAAAHSRHGGIVDGRHACPGACAPDVDIGVAGGRALLWVTTGAFHARSSSTARSSR